jgi:hypothetical protein
VGNSKARTKVPILIMMTMCMEEIVNQVVEEMLGLGLYGDK